MTCFFELNILIGEISLGPLSLTTNVVVVLRSVLRSIDIYIRKKDYR